jgi:hypothetical protein
MASLTELVRNRRESGQGVISSLAGSAQDKLKEKLNWRRMFNQDGLMTALFPQLRIEKNNQIQESNAELISSVALELSSELSIIETNTEIAAKNSMVLPLLARDMNVMRQNFSKFVRLMGGNTSSEADKFFKTSRQRETEYESAIAARGLTKRVDEEKPEDEKGLVKSFLSSIGGFFGTLISSITSAIKFVFSSILGTLKFLLSTVIGKILGIVSGVLLSIVGVVTSMVGKIFSKLLSVFTKLSLGWGTILKTILTSAVGVKALVAALVTLGIYKALARIGDRNQLISRLSELQEISRTQGLTESERAEYEALKAQGVRLPTQQAQEVALKSEVSKFTSEFIIEVLENNYNTVTKKTATQRDIESATNQLNSLGVSLKALKLYHDTMFGGDTTHPKAGMTLGKASELVGEKQTLISEQRALGQTERISAALSSDEFFSDINTPTLTSPEQPFNVNQASIDVKRLFSTLRTTNVDGSVNTTTVPENNSPTQGEPTQNLPNLSDVFDMEIVRKVVGNQQPIYL